ncbi:hypothetical protein PpBr36_02769 [Pyricularia pennisetigena]|uniref:hypothetical protein n=1 Tax=Pyricularia pennisetigena TaxID=1578925 RepID=UPI0011542755|nr:hypothetical protein PpBr36_02769 [Pyricularia pennisetigena]TLS29874.1 hypothetical protein PpBr36_02769 [Pyricularia pennisetigena]
MPGPRASLPSLSAVDNVCWRCCSSSSSSSRPVPGQRLTRLAIGNQAQPLSTSPARPLRFLATTPVRTAAGQSPRPKGAYFLSNVLLERFGGFQFSPRSRAVAGISGSNISNTKRNATVAADIPPSTSTVRPPVDEELPPHRRRQAARRTAEQAASDPSNAPSGAAQTTPVTPPPAPSGEIPPDASSILSNAAAAQPAQSLRRRLTTLLALSKPRLTMLVVLSAMAPYALYPVPDFLTPGVSAPSLSPLTLLFLTTGTTLCSAAANALNMIYEPKTDALMSRTRTRPLVRNLVSTRAAVCFALFCATTGILALHLGVNPTVAFLGAANIVLYAGIYTPLKRVSAVNTWVGAVVGGIPPLMGWAAAAGESAVGDGSWRELLFAPDGSSAGGWLFAALLFAWQFPHFMALSWGVRDEYRAAGLRMLAWTNPARNARVALRYGFVFVPLCVGLCAVGVTEWSFAVTSLPVNLWLVRESVRFWRAQGAAGSARGLFWASVWHLPVVMVLALLQKKGMWGRIWRSVFGDGDPDDDLAIDDDGWEYLDENEEPPAVTTRS